MFTLIVCDYRFSDLSWGGTLEFPSFRFSNSNLETDLYSLFVSGLLGGGASFSIVIAAYFFCISETLFNLNLQDLERQRLCMPSSRQEWLKPLRHHVEWANWRVADVTKPSSVKAEDGFGEDVVTTPSMPRSLQGDLWIHVKRAEISNLRWIYITTRLGVW